MNLFFRHWKLIFSTFIGFYFDYTKHVWHSVICAVTLCSSIVTLSPLSDRLHVGQNINPWCKSMSPATRDAICTVSYRYYCVTYIHVKSTRLCYLTHMMHVCVHIRSRRLIYCTAQNKGWNKGQWVIRSARAKWRGTLKCM